MKILRIAGFLLLNLLVLKHFEVDRRGKENNPEGLPSDLTHLPGGGTVSGEEIPLAGPGKSVELIGSEDSDQADTTSLKTTVSQDPPDDLGWMATGTPGAGGEIGEAAREKGEVAREKKDR